MSYYDTGLAFNPEGDLLQVEYARQAVNRSRTTLTFVVPDGIFVMYEKSQQPFIIDEPEHNKLTLIDKNYFILVAGRNGDTNEVLTTSKQIYRQHILNYGETPNIRCIAQNIRKLFYTPTTTYTRRPFGCNVVVAGNDPENETKYALFLVDADGSLIKQKYTISGIDKIRLSTLFFEKYTANSEPFKNSNELYEYIIKQILPQINSSEKKFRYYLFKNNQLSTIK